MKALIRTLGILAGAVFIFSGLVKAIDPLGSAYKFNDYFTAFNLGFLKGTGIILAILLCTAEFIAGFSVLTGIRYRAGLTLMALMMAIFTPLTLYLAISNPVTDCGCFGDAVKLTNTQTFLKNVVLAVIVLFLFINRKTNVEKLRPAAGWVTIVAASILLVMFSFYNLRYLPVIDFLPYKKGTDIAEGMKVPEGKSTGRYETTFIYEKDGVRKEFDLSNYPASDTTWVFIDQKSKLVEKGYQPPIHDFVLTAQDGSDLTNEILEYPGTTVLMISRKLEDGKESHMLDGFDLGQYCLNKGIRFYVLTASGTEKITEFEFGFTILSADETTLKTMIRSNPGYMLIVDGVIQGKWSWANRPENEWFGKFVKNDY